MKSIILYFVKYPTPGKVKTRLAKRIGIHEAAQKYRELAESNLKTLDSLSEKVSITVAFDPPDAHDLTRDWLSDRYAFLAQQGGNLGERLHNAFQEAFDNGASKVFAIGSDTLGLETSLIEDALEALEFHDVVLGPARDGGYYLIGFSRLIPELFQGIPWSTSSVLSRTISVIQQMDLSFFLLKPLEDLDE